MGKIISTSVCFLLTLTLIYCDRATGPGNQSTRVSGITETGPDGPDDLIGTIDQHDWDPTFYAYLTMTDRYWMYPVSDTIFASPYRIIKIHNLSEFPMSVVISASEPFMTSRDSIFLSPLETSSLYFNIDSNVIGQNTSASGEASITISPSEQYKYFLRWTRPPQRGTGGGVYAAVPKPIDCLYPAYPNPATGYITIEYSVHAVQAVRLYVLDDKLRVVDTLVNGYQNAGTYLYTWLTTSEEWAKFPAGMYRIEMQTGSYYCVGDVQLQK